MRGEKRSRLALRFIEKIERIKNDCFAGARQSVQILCYCYFSRFGR